MRAAAKLGGEVADLDHTHLVAVLFAEERGCLKLVHRDVDGYVNEGFHLVVRQHLLVHDVLDLLQLLVGNTGEVREVKTQPIAIVQ